MSGENSIIHYGAVRTRVVGTGKLRISLHGYDFILSETLVPIDMSATIFRQEQRLANFQSQECMIRIETTDIDDYMEVNSVTLFVKGLWSEYPQ
jgi:hypothetical protein